MRRKTSEEMYPLIGEYLRGTISLGKLCATNKLSKGQFYYWYRKYQSEKAPTNKRKFVRLSAPNNTQRYSLEITIPSGITIRSDDPISIDYLKSLLELR